MTSVFSHTHGKLPLLISIPHDGRDLMPGQAERMTEAGRALPDTDWFVKRLYGFAGELGASLIAANYSRYVVDLNRPADDAALYPGQVSTGLCPLRTFAGDAIYVDGDGVNAREQNDRVKQYWRPYHDKIALTLDQLRHEFGYALLWDAHSIASEVPMLFPGTLTDINIGSNRGGSCAQRCESAVMQVAKTSKYSSVLNGRFCGGYITRHYGDPAKNIYALQLELSQRCYMDENSLHYDAGLAAKVSATISKMLVTFSEAAMEIQ
jgi:N-formylglutamate deformylase